MLVVVIKLGNTLGLVSFARYIREFPYYYRSMLSEPITSTRVDIS